MVKFKRIELTYDENHNIRDGDKRLETLDIRINHFLANIKPQDIINSWWGDSGWRFCILYKEK